jgi:protein TonB
VLFGVLSALLLIRPPATEVEEIAKVIPWPNVVPMFTPAPAPVPAGGGGARAHAGPPRAQRRRELLAPAAIPKTLDLETFAPPDEGPEKPLTGMPIGPAAPSGGGKGSGEGSGTGTGSCTGNNCDVLGMFPPQLVERGREPQFTPEALEAHVEGLMTIQCVVTLAGRLEQCQTLQSLPFMERAVVEALMTRRYTPATLNGRPLAVRYVFHVKLVMPR